MYGVRGVARLFKMRGGKGDSGASGGGADWHSKWRLSIDLCTKCNFIGGWGGRVSARGRSPPAPPGYATVWCIARNIVYVSELKECTLETSLFKILFNQRECRLNCKVELR